LTANLGTSKKDLGAFDALGVPERKVQVKMYELDE